MAIESVDNYMRAFKQVVGINKLTARTTIAAGWFSMFDISGSVSVSGGLSSSLNTASGVVPIDTDIGYPTLIAFSASALGYVTRVEAGNTVAGRIWVYDRLFVAGAYPFTVNKTLVSQPEYTASRIFNNDYTATEIWVEGVTTFTGNLSIKIDYINQAGITGRTTGNFATGIAPTVGRCIPIPLQAGDIGVRGITAISSSVATVGTYNVMVLRKLWQGRVTIANDVVVHDLIRTGMPRVAETVALYPLIQADSTSTGLPTLYVEIANG